jgi:hypothetical protein
MSTLQKYHRMYVGDKFQAYYDKSAPFLQFVKGVPHDVQFTDKIPEIFTQFHERISQKDKELDELKIQLQFLQNNESIYKEKLRFYDAEIVQLEKLRIEVECQKSEIDTLHKELVDTESKKIKTQEDLDSSKKSVKDMIDLPFTIHYEIKNANWKELEFLDKECQLGVLDHEVWEKIFTTFPKIFPQLHNFLRRLIQTETEKNIILEKDMMVNFLCGWIVGMRDNGRNYIGKPFGTLLMSAGTSTTILQLFTRLRVTNCPTTIRKWALLGSRYF